MTDASNANGSPNTDQAGKLEIEGKVYTADDVKSLVAQQAELTQKAQIASKFSTVLSRYNVEPDVYLQNSEASLALMNDLIQKGIIDETGRIVEKQAQVTPQVQQITPMQQTPVVSKADATAMKALEDFHGKFKSIESEVQRLREDNLNLMRLRIGDQLKDNFPDLDEQDISRVIATAYNSDRQRPVMEVAKEFVESKKSWLESQKQSWAKEFGLDYEDLKKRKSFIEQGPEGGLGGMVAGKKVTFNKGKDPNAVTPRQATKAFFEMQEKYRRE